MKTNFKFISGTLVLFATILISACSTKPGGDEAKVGDEQSADSSKGIELSIDTVNSKIGFTGYGVNKNHPGFFTLNSGKVITSDGKLSGGNFEINMMSMVLTQPEEMFQTKLKGHLLSPDFFDAQKYPSAKFEITGVEDFTPSESDTSVVKGANVKISGNLTLKESTKNITFPAKVDVTDNSFSALANFTIDRTLWGMRYGNDKSLKDKFISEAVTITLDIKNK